METGFIVGLIVSAIMGALRRIWPNLFESEKEWAKAKRLLTSVFLALAGTAIALNSAGWQGVTIASFLMAWLTAWMTSQGIHNAAKLIPG